MSFDSSEAANLRAQIPGTKEFLIKQLEAISKEADQFRSAVGPRGAPVMVNPKTGEKEYGHNAKRIQHVKEHGDKREEPGEYRRTKDLQMPHGHESEIQEKAAEPSAGGSTPGGMVAGAGALSKKTCC